MNNERVLWANIIHIHINVLRDRRYYVEYSPQFGLNDGIIHIILPVPHNIVMNLNNVMDLKVVSLRDDCFKKDELYIFLQSNL